LKKEKRRRGIHGTGMLLDIVFKIRCEACLVSRGKTNREQIRETCGDGNLPAMLEEAA
jgi:hypothetical protein